MSKIDKLSPELREWLEARVVEQDGCWVWQLALCHGLQPQGRYKGKSVKVRRLILEDLKGEALPLNWFAVCRCKTAGCVHPAHLKAASRSSIQIGRVMPIAQKASIANARRLNAKVNDVAVAQIRDSDERTHVLAERHGISKDYVNQLRAHVAWKDYTNPFQGLMT